MNLVSFYTCGLFQNRGVAFVSYVLRLRFAATERAAKTAFWQNFLFVQDQSQTWPCGNTICFLSLEFARDKDTCQLFLETQVLLASLSSQIKSKTLFSWLLFTRHFFHSYFSKLSHKLHKLLMASEDVIVSEKNWCRFHFFVPLELGAHKHRLLDSDGSVRIKLIQGVIHHGWLGRDRLRKGLTRGNSIGSREHGGPTYIVIPETYCPPKFDDVSGGWKIVKCLCWTPFPPTNTNTHAQLRTTQHTHTTTIQLHHTHTNTRTQTHPSTHPHTHIHTHTTLTPPRPDLSPPPSLISLKGTLTGSTCRVCLGLGRKFKQGPLGSSSRKGATLEPKFNWE